MHGNRDAIYAVSESKDLFVPKNRNEIKPAFFEDKQLRARSFLYACALLRDKGETFVIHEI